MTGGALREAHAHIALHGRAMSMLRLADCDGAEDCLGRVSRAGAAMGSDPGWLLGVGLRVEGWAHPTWPTAAQLGRAAGARPVCLWSFDHHALVASTPALRAAGIGRGTPDPPGGRICRDGRGEPTGLLLEHAAKMVWSAAPQPGRAERKRQVLAALADFARCGFAEVHELHAPAWLGPLLAEIDDEHGLALDVLIYEPLEEIERAAERARGWRRERLALAGAKLFADGTLNSRTAWMLRPYADPLAGLACGQPMATPRQLAEAMRRVWGLGLGLAVHAIGDSAVRATLDAYESAGSGHAGVAGPRLRIEHAELIDGADVPRFASLGVAASVQPCHLLTDIEVLRRSLPHRLDRVLPLRELIDAGCVPGELLWFGSDAPIVRPDPEDSIRGAVHRRREGMKPGQMLGPDQAITPEEAWAAFSACRP